MFIYRTKIRLKSTDATGALYFSEQFNFAMETFEEFLKERGFSLKELMDSSYLFPVVHAQADYFAPLQVGDELEITLSVAKLGTSSVTLHYSLRNPHTEIDVGTVEIVHVVVDKQTRQSVPIPDFLKAILKFTKSTVVA